MTGCSRGQAIVFFALALPVALLPIAAYAAETSMLAARQAALSEATNLAALDAAQQLDVARLRAGRSLRLDRQAASDTATADLAASQPNAVVDAVGVIGATWVTVSVHEWVPLRLATFVRGAGVTLHATSTAHFVTGFESPD